MPSPLQPPQSPQPQQPRPQPQPAVEQGRPEQRPFGWPSEWHFRADTDSIQSDAQAAIADAAALIDTAERSAAGTRELPSPLPPPSSTLQSVPPQNGPLQSVSTQNKLQQSESIQRASNQSESQHRSESTPSAPRRTKRPFGWPSEWRFRAARQAREADGAPARTSAEGEGTDDEFQP